jgi:hypothetical protein
MSKRINKTKKDIVSDIQLTQDATRRRALVKDIVFPFLVETKESIGYCKIFLQSFSGLVNTVFDESAKKTTITDLTPRIIERLGEIFDVKNVEQKKEYDRYFQLLGSLKDISVQDLAYAAELPRYMDGFILQEKGKDSISTIPLDKIMG